MSYDVDIRKDDQFSETLDLPNVRAYIGSLPHVTIDDNLRLTFELDDEHYMEIYLAFFNQETKEYLLDEEAFVAQGKINCINIHIPYGCWSKQDKRPYFQFIAYIVKHLQWEAYDLQHGREIREIYSI